MDNMFDDKYKYEYKYKGNRNDNCAKPNSKMFTAHMWKRYIRIEANKWKQMQTISETKRIVYIAKLRF